MGTVVSLSKFKKSRARDERKKRGDQNAARFGLTLDQRRAQASERDRVRRELDGKKKE